MTLALLLINMSCSTLVVPADHSYTYTHTYILYTSTSSPLKHLFKELEYFTSYMVFQKATLRTD